MKLQALGWGLLAALTGWFYFEGVSLEGDPVAYAKLAAWQAEGRNIVPEGTFAHRWSFLLPLTWLTHLAGPDIRILVLWPWLSFFAMGLLMGWMLRPVPGIQRRTLILLIASPWLASFSVQLYPDLLTTALSLSAVLFLPHPAWGARISWPGWAKGLAFGSLLFFGFLAKITVLLLGPWLVWQFVRDVRSRQHFGFWAAAMTILFLFLAGWLGYFWLTTGNAFYPLEQIEYDHNASPFSYHWEDRDQMWRRLWLDPWLLLLGHPAVGVLLFAAVAGMFAPGLSWRELSWFWLYLLVVHWFASTSLSRYTPLPTELRMWMFLAPPTLVLAARGLTRTTAPQRAEWLIWLLMMGVDCWLLLKFQVKGAWITLAAGLVWVPISMVRRWVGICFPVLLGLWLVYQAGRRDERYYQHRELLLLGRHVPPGSTLLVDPALLYGDFLYEHLLPLHLIEWPPTLDSAGGQTRYFLWNGFRTRQNNLREARFSSPSYFDSLQQQASPIAIDSLFDIRLYALKPSAS